MHSPYIRSNYRRRNLESENRTSTYTAGRIKNKNIRNKLLYVPIILCLLLPAAIFQLQSTQMEKLSPTSSIDTSKSAATSNGSSPVTKKSRLSFGDSMADSARTRGAHHADDTLSTHEAPTQDPQVVESFKTEERLSEEEVSPPSTPIQEASDAARTLEEFTLVSFNMAGGEPSRMAPRGWTMEKTIEELRRVVLRSNPDILALQECPGDIIWATQVFPGYQAIGNTRSHADQVIMMVRQGIPARFVPIMMEDGDDVPAVVAELTYTVSLVPPIQRSMQVASVHLEPFRQGSARRREQMETLSEAAGLDTLLIVAGDTNMRQSEDVVMENNVGFVDFWKLAGSPRDAKFSWDTLDHKQYFNQYYGESTRQYTARYDRVYALGPKRRPASISVTDFQLIANQPIENKYHFLSDHFGICTTFSIDWSSD